MSLFSFLSMAHPFLPFGISPPPPCLYPGLTVLRHLFLPSFDISPFHQATSHPSIDQPLPPTWPLTSFRSRPTCLPSLLRQARTSSPHALALPISFLTMCSGRRHHSFPCLYLPSIFPRHCPKFPLPISSSTPLLLLAAPIDVSPFHLSTTSSLERVRALSPLPWVPGLILELHGRAYHVHVKQSPVTDGYLRGLASRVCVGVLQFRLVSTTLLFNSG